MSEDPKNDGKTKKSRDLYQRVEDFFDLKIKNQTSGTFTSNLKKTWYSITKTITFAIFELLMVMLVLLILMITIILSVLIFTWTANHILNFLGIPSAVIIMIIMAFILTYTVVDMFEYEPGQKAFMDLSQFIQKTFEKIYKRD